MLVKELVYSILDLIKETSDDAIINEDHILFLCKKYRSLLIKKEQDKEKGAVSVASEFEYQEICLNLEQVNAIDGTPCTGGKYLRSVEKIPKLMEGTKPTIFPTDFYQGTNITYISRDRMRYVGTNKYLQNIIYGSLGTDLHLFLKSSNPQFLYLKKIRLLGIFDDFEEAYNLTCDSTTNKCDVFEMEFPIRDSLVPNLIDLVLKESLGASYRPSDNSNNASDDLSDLINFIRRNAKSSLQKQIED